MDPDEFSDDGFDDLPDNALQELENRAIQSTQANLAQRGRPKSHYAGYDWEDNDDDLDTTEVTNDAGVAVGRPVVDKTLRQPTQQAQIQHRGPVPVPLAARPRPPLPNPRWNPTINLAGVEAPGTQQQQQQQQQQRIFPAQAPGPAHSQSFQFAPQPMPSQTQSSSILSALQRRVRALELELRAAQGEASLVRKNSTHAQQGYDAEIARLQRLNAEQSAKFERVVAAARAAERNATTELEFLQRDMKEVSERSRRRDGPPAAAARAGSATPRKSARTWGLADGFNDMDMVSSPSKGQGRSKNAGGSVAVHVGERTPSKGKRKRPVVDSPVTALETHVGDVDMMEDEGVASHPGPCPPIIAVPAAPFDFLQLVLSHGFARDQPPTFDMLSRFAFPSDPAGVSISTIIFEKLPLMGKSHLPMQLLVDFVQQIIMLWQRCYDEQFWDPIKYLASLIAFTLQLHASSAAPPVCHELVPIAQSTLFLVATGSQRFADGSIANVDEYGQLEQHIDATQMLSLLYTTAVACATTSLETEDGEPYSARRFWGLVSPEAMRMLLAPKQRAVVIVGALELLSTSSLPDSIGPIAAEGGDDDRAATAQAVIDRVSAKLTEHSRAASYTPEQKRAIRLAALRALIAFARHAFGARQLAAHKDALPRLVICLGTSIDDLYDQPIPASVLPPLPDCLAGSWPAAGLRMHEGRASAELYRIVSQCVLLIHALVTDPLTAELADMAGKLSVCHGGSQRYLVALGRLAFAEEDLVMEAGIEGEIVEAAHELLEMAVTPAEGETVSESFGV